MRLPFSLIRRHHQVLLSLHQLLLDVNLILWLVLLYELWWHLLAFKFGLNTCQITVRMHVVEALVDLHVLVTISRDRQISIIVVRDWHTMILLLLLARVVFVWWRWVIKDVLFLVSCGLLLVHHRLKDRNLSSISSWVIATIDLSFSMRILLEMRSVTFNQSLILEAHFPVVAVFGSGLVFLLHLLLPWHRWLLWSVDCISLWHEVQIKLDGKLLYRLACSWCIWMVVHTLWQNNFTILCLNGVFNITFLVYLGVVIMLNRLQAWQTTLLCINFFKNWDIVMIFHPKFWRFSIPWCFSFCHDSSIFVSVTWCWA